jgi:uncharacterized protein (TIGR00369 family)
MSAQSFKTSDPNSFYSQMLNGQAPRPAVQTLLGSTVLAVDADAGVASIQYETVNAFRNPVGTVQGGMLGAMLDDLTANLVDATLSAGQGVATLSLNISFLRPASVGKPLLGRAQMLRRGRDVCHVSGTLSQDGKDVATAVAVCKVVQV